MARGDGDIHAMVGNRDQLESWSRGTYGKFLIDDSGKFYSWQTARNRAPHHSAAAERLCVSVWLIDGVIDPDGSLEPTACVPGTDHAALIQRAIPQVKLWE